MTRFLLRLAAFSLIPLLFGIGVQVLAERLYYAPYLREIPAGAHTILLGDSHGDALGTRFDSLGTFNFSAPSDAYPDMLRKLRHAVRHAPNLRRVMLTADPHTLSAYRESMNNSDRSIRYLGAGEPDPAVANLYQDLKIRVLFGRVSLLNPKARDVTKAWLASLLRSGRAPRGAALPAEWIDEPNRAGRAHDRVLSQFPGPEVSASLEASLRAIVETARAGGLEVVGIKLPVSGDYLRNLDGKTYGADALLRTLGVEILDYQTVYQDRDSLFRDQDHLNERGADAFSSHFPGRFANPFRNAPHPGSPPR